MPDLDYAGICRFCLAVDSQNMSKLDEVPSVVMEMETCFSLRFLSEDPYPKQVCEECKRQIENMHYFHQTVMRTAKILHLHKERKILDRLYLSLKSSNSIIKDDHDTGQHNFNDNKEQKPIPYDYLNCQKLDTVSRPLEIINDTVIEPVVTKIEEDVLPKTDTIENDAVSVNSTPDAKENEPVQDEHDQCEDETVDVRESETYDKNNKKFRCLTCLELFDTKNLLLSHYNSEHKSHSQIKGKFETIQTDEGETVYKCLECDRTYPKKRFLTRHMDIHWKQHFFLCSLCGRTYLTASEILRHSRAHDGTRVYCSQNCGFSSPYLGALIQHEKRHTEGEYKYKCEECGKVFQVKTWYLQHQNIHKGIKPFACDICGLTFYMDRYLTAHKSSVHPQSSEVKRYACKVCLLPCDSRKAYTEHLKEHGIRNSFLCDACGKTLTSASLLRAHQRTHAGVRPFACSLCDKTFAKKFNLSLHERTHAGEKAFECAPCGRRYSQRSTLARHRKRHHENPSQEKCTKCSREFTSPRFLDAHKCT